MCLVPSCQDSFCCGYLVQDTYGAEKLPSKNACPSLLRHHQIRLKQSKNKKEREFSTVSCTQCIWWKSLRYLNASKGFATISLLCLVRNNLVCFLEVKGNLGFVINMMHWYKTIYFPAAFTWQTALQCFSNCPPCLYPSPFLLHYLNLLDWWNIDYLHDLG